MRKCVKMAMFWVKLGGDFYKVCLKCISAYAEHFQFLSRIDVKIWLCPLTLDILGGIFTKVV